MPVAAQPFATLSHSTGPIEHRLPATYHRWKHNTTWQRSRFQQYLLAKFRRGPKSFLKEMYIGGAEFPRSRLVPCTHTVAIPSSTLIPSARCIGRTTTLRRWPRRCTPGTWYYPLSTYIHRYIFILLRTYDLNRVRLYILTLFENVPIFRVIVVYISTTYRGPLKDWGASTASSQQIYRRFNYAKRLIRIVYHSEALYREHNGIFGVLILKVYTVCLLV